MILLNQGIIKPCLCFGYMTSSGEKLHGMPLNCKLSLFFNNIKMKNALHL